MSDASASRPTNDLQDAALSERLVAYLDRELPPRESEQVEQAIAHDEATRRQLEGFDRVWQALDALPVEKTEADFTRTTLALAAQSSLGGGAAAADRTLVTSPKMSFWRRLRWVTPAACALAAFALAWLAAWAPQRRTLETLPVALAADALKQIDDLDFLRRLAERTPELDLAAAVPTITAEADEWLQVAQMNLGQRRAWIEQLDDPRRQVVATRVASLRSAGPIGEPLAERHAELLAAPDSDRLARYAAAYGAFVASLSTGEQAELRKIDPEARARRVANDLRRWRLEQALEITPQERTAIAAHLDGVADSEAVAEAVRQIASGRGRRTPPGGGQLVLSRVKAAPASVFAKIGSAYRRSHDPRSARSPRDWFARFFAKELLRSWPAIEREIVEGLPQRLVTVLDEERLAQSERTGAVVHVLEQVAGGDGPDDLGAAFESLKSGQLIEYLAMPTDEMLGRLEERWAADAGFVEADPAGEWPPGLPPRPGAHGPGRSGFDRPRLPPGDPRRGDSFRGPPPPRRDGPPPRPR